MDLEEVVYSGLLGALSAGFIEGGGRNAKAELQVKDNGGSSAAGLRLLKSAQPAADAPLSLRGRSPWQSASSKAIDFRGTYDERGASGGTDSSLQAQNDPEASNRNANLQAQRVNTEPSADTQAAGRDSGVEAYVQRLREVMAGTGSDVTGANGQGISVNSGGTPLGGYTASGLSGHLLLPGEGNTAVSNSGTDAQVRQSDAGRFGVEQYGELLHQAGLDWDTAGKLSEIGLRVPSKIAESRSMAAPNVTVIPSGSMKAAGPQQRAVAADAESYARRLQEVMPEFAAENGDATKLQAKDEDNGGATEINVVKNQNNGKIKMGNVDVRKWYKENISKIYDAIDKSLSVEEQAKQAFEARNRLRTEARNMMEDEKARNRLDIERPNKSFEELIESKMKRKGMTREEAIYDILITAKKSNENVDKELGLGDE